MDWLREKGLGCESTPAAIRVILNTFLAMKADQNADCAVRCVAHCLDHNQAHLFRLFWAIFLKTVISYSGLKFPFTGGVFCPLELPLLLPFSTFLVAFF
jgi:hypothetical protein